MYRRSMTGAKRPMRQAFACISAARDQCKLKMVGNLLTALPAFETFDTVTWPPPTGPRRAQAPVRAAQARQALPSLFALEVLQRHVYMTTLWRAL